MPGDVYESLGGPRKFGAWDRLYSETGRRTAEIYDRGSSGVGTSRSDFDNRPVGSVDSRPADCQVANKDFAGPNRGHMKEACGERCEFATVRLPAT